MPYYPILVDIEGQKVIVVGGGRVAQRKIEALLKHGADVHVISRDLTPTLERYVQDGRINFLGREFKTDEIMGAFLVIAATDDPETNHKVSQAAKDAGLLINAVDQPPDCNFIVPSVVKRGDLLISVSTSGKSPALAKKLREELETRFGREYEGFLQLMGELRKKVLAKGLSREENSRIFHELVDSPLLEIMGREDWDAAASCIGRILGTRLSPDDVVNFLRAE